MFNAVRYWTWFLFAEDTWSARGSYSIAARSSRFDPRAVFFSKVLMPEEEEKEGRSEATVLLQGIWLLQQTRDYG